MGRQPMKQNTTPTFREGQTTRTDTQRTFENCWITTNYEKTTHETTNENDFLRDKKSIQMEGQSDTYANRHEDDCRTPKGRYESWEDNP